MEASKIQLYICTAYMPLEGKKGKERKASKAVMEVNLPSGYTFNTTALESLNGFQEVNRYKLEEAESKLMIYFKSLDVVPTCIPVSIHRVFRVANLVPASITVYDYYDNTLKGRVSYLPPSPTLSPHASHPNVFAENKEAFVCLSVV